MMVNAIHFSAAEIFSSEESGVYSRMCIEKKQIAVSKNPAVPPCWKRVFLYKFYNKKGNFSIFASLKLSIAGFSAAEESDGATD